MSGIFPEQFGGARSGLSLVVTRAALDRDFREKLLENPYRAVHEAFGVGLPARLRLKFIEKDPDLDLLIVLPDLVEDFGQLDPDQLDAVLGGSSDILEELLDWIADRD